MKTDTFFGTLEDICFQYQRLKALISITQSCVAECTGAAYIPDGAVSNALYEIELGLLNKT